jgi:exodeoxyribonuclease V alpha subunit
MSIELNLSQKRLADLIAASKGRLQTQTLATASNSPELLDDCVTTANYKLNNRQSSAVFKAKKFESFCFIGSAGTGKTTSVREIAKILTQMPEMTLVESDCKVLKESQAGIVCVSFTNIAVQNIASQMDGAVTCSTIHNLLEFKPTYVETMDATGNIITKRIFEPGRTKYNPLPKGIKVIILEEAGVVGTRLFNLLLDALQDIDSICFIFLGDLHQLAPVFDSPILGKKLLELPTIELTEVYRQALLSPILNLAIRIKDGEQLAEKQLKELGNGQLTEHGQLTIKFFQKKVGVDAALHLFQDFMEKLIASGAYSPEDTMILIPYNVGFGTVECNKTINHLLDVKHNRTVHEVISGYNKLYFAEGDIVYSKKRKAVITKITLNGKYLGKPAAKASTTLDRWGIDSSMSMEAPESELAGRLSVDEIMAQLESTDEVRKEAASHIIDIQLLSANFEESVDVLSTAAELNELIGGYCLTIHKAQGSEWTNGICWFHNSHAKFINRELLYTAVTRFKKSLLIIAEKDTILRGVKNQGLRGSTLAEKLVSLKEKLKEAETTKSY